MRKARLQRGNATAAGHRFLTGDQELWESLIGCIKRFESPSSQSIQRMYADLAAPEIGRLWFEDVWNNRNPNAARQLMTPDAVGHLEGGQIITGPEDFLRFQQEFLAAVPDLMVDIVQVVSDNENVCVQWRAEDMHTGDGMGFTATNGPVSFRGITWFRVVEGKIVEGRDYWNMGALMQVMSGAPPATI